MAFNLKFKKEKSITSGLFGGGGEKASKSAGQVQSAAAERGGEIAKEQLGITRGDLSPYLQAGNPALQQYMELLGIGGGGSQSQFGGAPRLTEQQIRDQLTQSGQFSTPSGIGRDEFEWQNKYGNAPPKTIGEAAQLWNARGQEVETFVNPQELLEAGLKVGGGTAGTFDQAGLDAEVQRRLGQQGQFTGGSQRSAIDSIYESPGQQFIRSRAQKNLLQNASALGGIGGGTVRTALVEQGAGFAAQDLQNQFARLQPLISGGQTAATNLGQFGQNYAQTAAGLGNQAAQAKASGILGAQQAQAQQSSNVLGLVGAGLSFFSDERLKTDISELSAEDCYNTVMSMDLKVWKYLEETGLDQSMHMGVLANDAPDCIKGEDVAGYNTLNLHDELTLVMGALKHVHSMKKVH